MPILARGLPDSPFTAPPSGGAVTDAHVSKKKHKKREEARSIGSRGEGDTSQKPYAISEDGRTESIVTLSDAEQRNYLAASQKAATGAKLSKKEYNAARDGTLQAFVRARAAKRGVTVDGLFDTLEDARQNATTFKGETDHNTRIKAVQVEAAMLGLIGPGAAKEQPTGIAEDARLITVAEVALTGAALWEATMRRVQAAMSGVPLEQIPPVRFDMSEDGVREERSKGIMLPIQAAQTGKEILEQERQARAEDVLQGYRNTEEESW
jgi:hypothetical protein